MMTKTVQYIVLNDNGYELVRELPADSNEWYPSQKAQIKILLESGENFLDGVDCCFVLKG